MMPRERNGCSDAHAADDEPRSPFPAVAVDDHFEVSLQHAAIHSHKTLYHAASERALALAPGERSETRGIALNDR